MFESSFGIWPLFLLIVAGVIIFGKDLPEVARSVARYLAELRQVFNSFRDLTDPRQWEVSLRPSPPPPPQDLPPRPVVRRPSAAPPFQE